MFPVHVTVYDIQTQMANITNTMFSRMPQRMKFVSNIEHFKEGTLVSWAPADLECLLHPRVNGSYATLDSSLHATFDLEQGLYKLCVHTEYGVSPMENVLAVVVPTPPPLPLLPPQSPAMHPGEPRPAPVSPPGTQPPSSALHVVLVAGSCALLSVVLCVIAFRNRARCMPQGTLAIRRTKRFKREGSSFTAVPAICLKC